MTAIDISKPPFNLSQEARDWVAQTRDGLSLRDKVAQTFVLISMGTDRKDAELIRALKPGGITRFFTTDRDHDIALLDELQHGADIPLLISADLEGSRMSLPFGTEVPNPLALAAIDDVEATKRISAIMAEEASAVGVNWTFTPVLDVNAAFRSPIVATRGFGSDPDRIARHALAQMQEFQNHGIATAVKHWPGEGYDDRDQHLVTTINPLDPAEWEAVFGRLYRGAINAGTMAVMSAHIALPAYIRALDPDAGPEQFCPASINPILNNTLLRDQLGFNGVIVSDASEMAGLTSWCDSTSGKIKILENGCDMILFSDDPAADMAAVEQAVKTGQIPMSRLDQAITRILAMKAALGLHKPRNAPQPERIAHPEHQASAAAITARAPTLVKDVQGLLPLDPGKHRRVLLFSGGIISPLHPEPMDFDLPDLLRSEGFEVTDYAPGIEVSAANFDLILYLFGEETLLTRGRIFLDWAKLGGNFIAAMKRHWHDIPTAMISFGYPYYLYDAPRVPTYVNAYATMPSMQEAVLNCLLGRAAWNETSPVDAFCGLPDAAF